MCRIKEVFSKKFETCSITIDEADVFVGNKKKIPQKDWTIKFVVDEDERGIFLEYYGMNSRNIHMHGRIYNDGQEQILDVLQEYIAYRPNVPGDRERGTKEFERYNEQILNRLKKMQLL
ncbi:hypothetical protein [Cellulosilyticum sp. I15G10I2]|uniref:hypothetical protein n=1 Tax=Cellulosilyticum sp. I15G10I2 TaxID=1892843 RepID=UPI00085C233D|nr:hypothetical protein [Cellulosilyticum sp. I15G10I2]